MADQFPQFWPGWETVKILGRGSFGTVYEIRRELLGKSEGAALKVISIPKSRDEIDELYSEGFSQESITKRFQSYLQNITQEYALMQEMKGHTNIVYCDDLRYIQHDDGIGWDIYIKMELLTSMTKALPVEVPEEVVIKAGLDLCNALMLCKKKHIVHRDIKPQNIFISRDGDFKLGDFGIARTMDHTTSGTKTGTYKYMAPEVYHSQPYGAASDIYSLGLVLYWLLNQRRMAFLPLPPRTPTVTEEDSARARRLKGEPLPPPLHGSQELQRIVLKACAFRPEDRYASPAEMHQDLTALASGISDFQTAAAIPRNDREDLSNESTIVDTSGRRKKQKWLLLAAGLAAALAMAAGAVLFHPHQWQSAACGIPETCSLCGETRGKAAGHSWQEATCDTPKTCTDCGFTEGTAASHQWSGATCAAPETCALCGLTQGEPGDHQYLEATYISPASCQHCGLTQGLPLGAPLSAGADYSMVRKADGSILVVGNTPWGTTDTSGWQNIVAVSAASRHMAALRADGTVIAAGYQATQPQGVAQWTDIVQIGTDSRGSAGLKADGTFVSTGSREHGLGMIMNWENVASFEAGYLQRFGLKADGTVIAIGDNDYGQCDVEGWTDIVSIAAGGDHTVGLKSDGTVVAIGNNSYSQCMISGWKDVVAIDAGEYFTVALHADGTVSAIGDNYNNQCDLSHWTDIVYITAGFSHVLGLKSDGTIVAAGRNDSGQCDIDSMSIY